MGGSGSLLSGFQQHMLAAAREMPLDYEHAEVIESYSDHSFAEAAISLLASEGIEAVIHADDAGGELPNLGFARGVRVLVDKDNAERARMILDAGSEEAD